jgi:hypothetical protein
MFVAQIVLVDTVDTLVAQGIAEPPPYLCTVLFSKVALRATLDIFPNWLYYQNVKKCNKFTWTQKNKQKPKPLLRNGYKQNNTSVWGEVQL